MSQQLYSWVYIQKKENINLKRHMHPNVHSTLSTTAKIWKQPELAPMEEWIKMQYTHTQQNITYPEKRMTFCHLQQHEWSGLGRYYAK